MKRRTLGLVCLALCVVECKRGPQVEAGGPLPIRSVVVYRNGVGYFERRGRVESDHVEFRVLPADVGDFLATLVVMEQGGSSVRSAAFPIDREEPAHRLPVGERRRAVGLSLDGARHDLVIGYMVATPVWRPSYRVVYSSTGAQLQAWGIVQNVSGEDWSNVRLSLVAGAPVSFRSNLAETVITTRPMVTDQGEVIDAVPRGENVLAEEVPGEGAPSNSAPTTATTSPAQAANGAMTGDQIGDAFGYGGLGTQGTGWGGGGTGEGTIGLGDLGTMGHGAGTGSGQGYGSGAGGGLRGRSAAGPVVRASVPSVSGLLSPEAIRRVVLRNIGQVRFCYEQGLAADPSAGGRVTVRFIIGADGAVMGSNVADSSLSVPSVGNCIANAVRRWQFPSPEGGGIVTVNYPFNLQSGDGAPSTRRAGPGAPPPPSSVPRSMASLAAIAQQGGATRYDLPNTVTVPNESATMVLLISREVPGSRMYLFAPDPGVPDSSQHPFQVARFENRTGAMLERGPVAIFEARAFLGQGMLDPLPEGASATIPFSLERALAVETSQTSTVEGARLVAVNREQITLERYNTTHHTLRVRNGMDTDARVMVRLALASGAEVHNPPAGTEVANNAALVPVQSPRRGRQEIEAQTRSPFRVTVDWTDGEVSRAIEEYLRDGQPAAAVAATLRSSLELQHEIATQTLARAGLETQRNDLQVNTEETRSNLDSIRGNPGAADLRARLTARLGSNATQVANLTRRIVEIDASVGERRVRLAEAVRELSFTVPPPATPAAPTAPH